MRSVRMYSNDLRGAVIKIAPAAPATPIISALPCWTRVFNIPAAEGNRQLLGGWLARLRHRASITWHEQKDQVSSCQSSFAPDTEVRLVLVDNCSQGQGVFRSALCKPQKQFAEVWVPAYPCRVVRVELRSRRMVVPPFVQQAGHQRHRRLLLQGSRVHVPPELAGEQSFRG